MGARKGTWIAGAAFIGVVVLIGTWFLGVSPVLDETARLTAESETTRAQNAQLEAKLQQLSADSAKLPELKAELAQLQVGIPATAQVDEFLRWVDQIQTARQIPTVKVEVADPMSVVDNRGALTPEPAPTDASSASPSPEASASPDETAGAENADASTAEGAATAVAGPDGFVAVPVTITVLGDFVSSLGFVSDLQSPDGRLFLVTDLEGFGQEDAAAADGRPATVRGDIELTITGNLYVLIDPAGLAEPELQQGSLPSLDPSKPALDAGA